MYLIQQILKINIHNNNYLLPLHRPGSNTVALGPSNCWLDDVNGIHPWRSWQSQTPFRILCSSQFWRIYWNLNSPKKNEENRASLSPMLLLFTTRFRIGTTNLNYYHFELCFAKKPFRLDLHICDIYRIISIIFFNGARIYILTLCTRLSHFWVFTFKKKYFFFN